ncbi:ABC transporter permease [Lentibacillus sp. Marseille-P4043]|uniref:ABC transporter permease n=1 Tax=Lentibacillus sp. Marseille-P4043 TaxID=2040293 RepID=UPI000D0B2667|nr:ABC transporter permease [Lentibacillus sp. Marseille-P4043]
MLFINHLFLFIKHDFKKLRRKWPSLPLLLLFPIVIITLCSIMIVSFIDQDERDPIQIGLVDLDQSKETQLVVKLIEESSQLGNYISINALSKEKADSDLKQNNLSAYITFPQDFTEHLYHGKSVALHITGNPNKPTESFVIKELLDSVSRHIRAAQANILTINFFAKQLPMGTDELNDMLFDQFTSFVLYTIGKDKILDEETVTNRATNTPLHYYALASWFIIVTIWLIAFYSFLTRDDHVRMKQRMRLYGVSALQQLLAKIITTLTVTAFCAAFVLYAFQQFTDITLYKEDYGRIAIITLLYSFIFLQGLALIETIIQTQKLRLLMQSLFTGFTLFISGAIIPSLYFPTYLQTYLPYSFSNQAFHWLQEIVLNERFYADYLPLLCLTLAGFFLLSGVSLWKERVNR